MSLFRVLRTTTDWLITWDCGHLTRVIQDDSPVACSQCGCLDKSDTVSHPFRLDKGSL